MALSNIFREPRREIVETAVGFLVVSVLIGGFVWVDYYFAHWFWTIVGDPSMPLFIAYGVGFLAIGVACLGILIVHEVGDGICNSLQRRGIHLRPCVRK